MWLDVGIRGRPVPSGVWDSTAARRYPRGMRLAFTSEGNSSCNSLDHNRCTDARSTSLGSCIYRKGCLTELS